MYRLVEKFAKKVRELIEKVPICRVFYIIIDKNSSNGNLLLLLVLFVLSTLIRKTTLYLLAKLVFVIWEMVCPEVACFIKVLLINFLTSVRSKGLKR